MNDVVRGLQIRQNRHIHTYTTKRTHNVALAGVVENCPSGKGDGDGEEGLHFVTNCLILRGRK